MRLQCFRVSQGLVDLDLKWAGVEFKEQLALLDDVTVLEVECLDVASHPRPDFQSIMRLQPTVIVILVYQVANNWMRHGDSGRLLRFVSDGVVVVAWLRKGRSRVPSPARGMMTFIILPQPSSLGFGT